MEEITNITSQRRKENGHKSMKDVEKEFEELEEGLEKKEIKIPVKQMMTLGPKLVKLLNSFILQ